MGKGEAGVQFKTAQKAKSGNGAGPEGREGMVEEREGTEGCPHNGERREQVAAGADGESGGGIVRVGHRVLNGDSGGGRGRSRGDSPGTATKNGGGAGYGEMRRPQVRASPSRVPCPDHRRRREMWRGSSVIPENFF